MTHVGRASCLHQVDSAAARKAINAFGNGDLLVIAEWDPVYHGFDGLGVKRTLKRSMIATPIHLDRPVLAFAASRFILH